MTVMTLVDLLRIQDFIFVSNRLSDIIAGSWLVEKAIKRLVPDSFPPGVNPDEATTLIGGGNALLEFDDMAEATEFAGRYTRLLFREAPGLEAAIVHKEYEKGTFLQTYQAVHSMMFCWKQSRPSLLQMPGLGITEPCRETGLPSAGFDDRTPVSKTILVRRRTSFQKEIDDRWSALLDHDEEASSTISSAGVRLAFPKNLDDMGRRRGEVSLMGVVHIDGNDMGLRMKRFAEGLIGRGTSDDTGRQALREIFEDVTRAGEDSVRKCVARVKRAIVHNPTECQGGLEYSLRGHLAEQCLCLSSKGSQLYLPFRPIVVGGDDITLVCDARIALDLAEVAMTEFERAGIRHIGPVTSSAGVSILGTHTPFIRAYKRSESLCREAKVCRRHLMDSGRNDSSFIDWHIETSDSTDDINELRAAQYSSHSSGSSALGAARKPSGPSRCDLIFRPYSLDVNAPCNWRWFSRTLLSKCLLEGPWAGHRGKVMDLVSAVRKGKEAAKAQLTDCSRLDSRLELPDPIKKNDGFYEFRTPIVDAAELLDLYICLDGGDE